MDALVRSGPCEQETILALPFSAEKVGRISLVALNVAAAAGAVFGCISEPSGISMAELTLDATVHALRATTLCYKNLPRGVVYFANGLEYVRVSMLAMGFSSFPVGASVGDYFFHTTNLASAPTFPPG